MNRRKIAVCNWWQRAADSRFHQLDEYTDELYLWCVGVAGDALDARRRDASLLAVGLRLVGAWFAVALSDAIGSLPRAILRLTHVAAIIVAGFYWT